MKEIPKISQSLMKSYVKYLNKQECGLLFEAKYIDKTLFTEPSEAMALGIYFEYLATGMLPKSGKEPLPEYTLKGVIKEPYKRAQESAEFFKRIIAHYNIKILQTGLYVATEEENGVLDMLAEWDGKKVIIDLKYSGLLEDKWNPLGWEIESLPMKDDIMVQGVHYKMLVQKAMGIETDFYYFVFDTKDSSKMKIIKQEIDEDRFAVHANNLTLIKEKLAASMSRGFKAYPEYNKCIECPLFETCDVKATMPLPITVHY